VLLVEKDPLIRDLVKVALQQFQEFQVTVGNGYAGVGEARSHRFDCVFLGVALSDPGSIKLVQHLRSFEQDADLFLLTDEANVKDLAADKAKYQVHSIVQTPITPKDLFGVMSRYLERRSERNQPAAR